MRFSVAACLIILCAPLTVLSAFKLDGGEVVVDGEIRAMPFSKLRSWARAQGFRLVEPNKELFSQGYVISPPGVTFHVPPATNEKGDLSHTGYSLQLFVGNLVSMRRSQELSSDYKYYENILRFSVTIDGISAGSFEMGYGQSLPEEIIIPIPYVRDPFRPLKVEVGLANHPANFLIWYGCSLVRRD